MKDSSFVLEDREIDCDNLNSTIVSVLFEFGKGSFGYLVNSRLHCDGFVASNTKTGFYKLALFFKKFGSLSLRNTSKGMRRVQLDGLG